MIYKITFFKRDISNQDWFQFFQSLFSVVKSIPLSLILQGNRIDFFLESDKTLDSINNRLHPFCLTNEITDEEVNLVQKKPEKKSLLPKLVNKSLIEFIEDERINGKDISKITFKLKKFNLFKAIPKIGIFYTKKEELFQVNARITKHLYEFLTFNLCESIIWDISKIKPSLKIKDFSLGLEEDGILETSQTGKRNKIPLKSFDFDRHSLILGQSGSGKSFLAKLAINDLYQNFSSDYSVVLIDPHASLEKLLGEIPSQISVNFKNNQTNLFLNVNQPVLSTELTLDLFSAVLKTSENQNLLRTLKHSLGLLFSINKMNFVNLKKLLTDSLFRKEIIKEVTDLTILKFFETEFQQMRTSHYNDAVLPILNLISEMDFVENVEKKIDLPQAIDNYFLVSLPISQAELGTNVTKIIGGAIIQQVFTIVQTRMTNKKIILLVDEFAIVQTPSLVHILSEARKFGLTIILTQQYLLQVTGDILSSLFANMVNYFCFKLSRDDAEIVAKNLNFEIDEYFLKNKNDPRESQELGTKLLTDLGTREVISRVMSKGQYCSPFKSKTIKVKMEGE